MEQVQSHAGNLFAEADAFYEQSSLPYAPDRVLVDRVLVEVTQDWSRSRAA